MLAAALAASVAFTGCILQGSPTPNATSSPAVSVGPSPSATQSFGPTAEPSPSQQTLLRLPSPSGTDGNAISYTVTVEVKAGASGRLVLVVKNLGDELVPELVLRWPTAVRDTIFLAPFTPSKQRIREGGDPLVQDWTKWVDGPGESGEPAGTTSLGWGPLLVGGTLTIPILATRVAPGPVAFDFQILNGEKVLQSNGDPAWFEVDVP
ncbi:MAG TPA: hypothetical protein VIM66_00860 [Candidatus Limnocylindria bacterium]|jgi:hypothetical protein